MPEDSFLYMIDSMVKTCKWLALQAVLFFLMPYVWNYEYCASTTEGIRSYRVSKSVISKMRVEKAFIAPTEREP